MTDEELQVLKDHIDRRAGKVHSAEGRVMTTLNEILTMHEQMLRSKISDDIMDSTVREMDRGTMLLCAQIALAGTTPA
jgi:hypothetical protein